jgi:16S rRNA (uracil1498-N3)-methyltransferase
VEKLTELGATKIMALETERCVRAGAQATSDNKLKRWHAIAKAAALQCERALIPDVVAAQSLPQLLEKMQAEDTRILICAERSQAQSLSTLLANDNSLPDSPSLVVLVGPEGGFTENEFKMVEQAGAQSVTLGKRILRSETAAVYAASLIVGCLDK